MPVSVEIFGVKGYVFDEIRAQLVERLEHAAIDYMIKDLQRIDDFISEGIESVPAVRVNHKRLFTKSQDMTTDQVVSAVMQYVSAYKQQQIICPIDFSTYSLTAAAFAMHFAHEFRMGLQFIHILRPSTEIGFPGQAEKEKMEETLRQKVSHMAREQGLAELAFQSETYIGDPLQVIVRLSKEATTGLIVMGTRGLTGISRKLLGTISLAVTRHSFAPVLLIPPHINFKKPEHIMIAFHEEMVTNGSIKALIDLNRMMQASLHFVNVHDYGDYPVLKDKVTELLFAHGEPAFSFDIRQIRQGTSSVLQALTSYAEQQQPDIMVFITRNRNGIRSLIQPGLTAKMQAHLKWPLLVMRNV